MFTNRLIRSQRLLFLTLLLCGTVGAARAQSGSPWSIRSWQVDRGLPDNNVTGIAQTSEGYLWVATQAGLARFDGERFLQWPLPIASGPSNSLIRSLMLGRDDSLWVALEAEAGLVINVSASSTNIFNAASGVPNCKPLGLTQTADGATWAGYVDGSVCRFFNGKLERFGAREGLPGTGGSWVAATTDDALWFARGGHVGVFADGRFQIRFDLPESAVRIAAASSGGIWILAGRRLLKCTDGKTPVELARLATVRAGVDPSILFEDRGGALWLGTTAGGLFHWDGREIVSVETTHSDITSIMEDREGNLWVGTEGGGFDRFRNRILELHNSSRAIPFEAVRSVCEDRGGTLWAVGANGALVRFLNGEWRTLTNAPGWTDARATCVTDDRAGGVWVGTYRAGLFHWHDGAFTQLTRENGLGGDVVHSLLVDSRGDLWIGLQVPDRLQRLRGSEFKILNQPVNSRPVRSAVEDANGKIWFGTQDGYLLSVDGDTLVDETAHVLQPTKPIRALHATSDGGLWIGYAGVGVGWLHNGHFDHFSTEQGLPDENICGIQSDDNGALWFTSGRGIFQVRRREFESVAAGRENRVLALEFGRDEGLLNLQGSYGYWPTAIRRRDGEIWFATKSGLVSAQPHRLQPNRIAPVVLIERLLVDGKAQPVPANGRPLRLPPTHRKIELEFTALNFAAPENILLEHRLEGWDENWSEPKKDRVVTFSRLGAGNYQFHVIARNAAGIWNREGAHLAFVVEPFLWQRWWFRLATVVLFTAIVIAIVRYVSFRRLRVRLQRLEQESALNRDRARIAQDLHDDLGANLTQIALLSELAQDDLGKQPEARRHIDQIFRTARSLTRSLDEIVWSVSPRNDTLDRYVAHLCTYAPEFLHSAGMRCRLDVPVEVPAIALPSGVRHHLHLAVKEALHNVVKHSGAHEVRLQLRVMAEHLAVTIEDDGRGLSANPGANPGQDGLSNLRERMKEIGGACEQQGSPAGGTRISFTVPLTANAAR